MIEILFQTQRGVTFVSLIWTNTARTVSKHRMESRNCLESQRTAMIRTHPPITSEFSWWLQFVEFVRNNPLKCARNFVLLLEETSCVILSVTFQLPRNVQSYQKSNVCELFFVLMYAFEQIYEVVWKDSDLTKIQDIFLEFFKLFFNIVSL